MVIVWNNVAPSMARAKCSEHGGGAPTGGVSGSGEAPHSRELKAWEGNFRDKR